MDTQTEAGAGSPDTTEDWQVECARIAEDFLGDPMTTYIALVNLYRLQESGLTDEARQRLQTHIAEVAKAQGISDAQVASNWAVVTAWRNEQQSKS